MIIDRASVKLQAREIIQTSKPSPIVAGLLYTLLSAFIGYLSLRLTGVDMETMTNAMQMSQNGYSDRAVEYLMNQMPGTGASLIDVLLRLEEGEDLIEDEQRLIVV